MAEYIYTGPLLVEAMRFPPYSDEVDFLAFEKWAMERGGADIMAYHGVSLKLKTADGFFTYAQPGTWVVSPELGVFHVLQDAEFQKTYAASPAGGSYSTDKLIDQALLSATFCSETAGYFDIEQARAKEDARFWAYGRNSSNARIADRVIRSLVGKLRDALNKAEEEYERGYKDGRA